MVTDHITQLGYSLQFADDAAAVAPLLSACSMRAIREEKDPDWGKSEYLLACTTAGGTAASIGWTQVGDSVIIHSLAVAPSSRGTGIGVGLVAALMGYLMDKKPIHSIFLTTSSSTARRLFLSTGFHEAEAEEIPAAVSKHPVFADARDHSRPMIRDYKARARGVDNCAFRLILNETEEATLPLGSVFFFRQSSNVLAANYRGGKVIRGHLLGEIKEDVVSFCWHQYTDQGRLMSGDGSITLDSLPDGRRELKEQFQGSGTLLLREV